MEQLTTKINNVEYLKFNLSNDTALNKFISEKIPVSQLEDETTVFNNQTINDILNEQEFKNIVSTTRNYTKSEIQSVRSGIKNEIPIHIKRFFFWKIKQDTLSKFNKYQNKENSDQITGEINDFLNTFLKNYHEKFKESFIITNEEKNQFTKEIKNELRIFESNSQPSNALNTHQHTSLKNNKQKNIKYIGMQNEDILNLMIKDLFKIRNKNRNPNITVDTNKLTINFVNNYDIDKCFVYIGNFIKELNITINERNTNIDKCNIDPSKEHLEKIDKNMVFKEINKIFQNFFELERFNERFVKYLNKKNTTLKSSTNENEITTKTIENIHTNDNEHLKAICHFFLSLRILFTSDEKSKVSSLNAITKKFRSNSPTLTPTLGIAIQSLIHSLIVYISLDYLYYKYYNRHDNIDGEEIRKHQVTSVILLSATSLVYNLTNKFYDAMSWKLNPGYNIDIEKFLSATSLVYNLTNKFYDAMSWKLNPGYNIDIEKCFNYLIENGKFPKAHISGENHDRTVIELLINFMNAENNKISQNLLLKSFENDTSRIEYD